MPVTLLDLRDIASKRCKDVAEGESLDSLSRGLCDLAVKSSVTALDGATIDQAIHVALEAGASPAQLEEVISLVSGLGVHSLMVAAPRIVRAARAAGHTVLEAPLDAAQRALWNEKVGDNPYWVAFEREMPGFLDSLLRLSPTTFKGFFDYCELPWVGRAVSSPLKELMAMAVDATPQHRFTPGFTVHLANAIHLGAGRRAILEALDIAAACPPHRGIESPEG